jgi:hypothetical protein
VTVLRRGLKGDDMGRFGNEGRSGWPKWAKSPSTMVATPQGGPNGPTIGGRVWVTASGGV